MKLYKRVSADEFVSFDPATNDYQFVPADRAPPMEPVAERVRLSHSQQREDPAARFRRVAALSMLALAEQAHEAGDPGAAAPHLFAVAHLAADRGAERRLRLSLSAAIGGRADPVFDGADVFDGYKPTVSVWTTAVTLWATMQTTAAPSLAQLGELARNLPALDHAETRRAKVSLNAVWNGAKSVAQVAHLADEARRLVGREAVRLSQMARPAPPVTSARPRAAGTYTRL